MDYGAALEEGVTGWWHGGSARFELRLAGGGHAAQCPADCAEARSSTLVVAFSSLGNGLIRPEFRGTFRDAAPDCDALYVQRLGSCGFCKSGALQLITLHPPPASAGATTTAQNNRPGFCFRIRHVMPCPRFEKPRLSGSGYSGYPPGTVPGMC